MAIAISGAIITGQTGTLMNYKKKCEKCGQVQPGTTSSPDPKSIGTKMN
mgnify:CR=1 FL=1